MQIYDINGWEPGLGWQFYRSVVGIRDRDWDLDQVRKSFPGFEMDGNLSALDRCWDVLLFAFSGVV